MKEKEFVMEAVETLDAKKGKDIVLLDVAEKSSFADYLLMVSGHNERQVGGLADNAEDRLAELGLEPRNVEGTPASGWILLDYGDFIINVMTEDMRSRYKIENLWADCPVLVNKIGEED